MRGNTEACLDGLFLSVPAARNFSKRKIPPTILKLFKNGKNW